MEPSLKEDMKKMMSYLNLDIDDFKIITDTPDSKQLQISTYHKIKENLYEFDLQMESSGTQKLFYLLPLVIVSLSRGNVLIVDELDAKLHPKMLERIIKLYTDKRNNLKGAQLIFTSHDLSTMNNKVFRRDEIWFAAKDDKESTQLYSLADIKEENGERIRTDAAYNKQYLEGRYGADPYFKNINAWGKENE
ncbi:MAG: ATP-binding protein [Candidatus Moranbacteria bacterium]|nr:ATP-binding protein [Candidatus Moranbacteria bacterium]